MGAGPVSLPHRRREVDATQDTARERGQKRITGSQAVDDLHPDRWHLEYLVALEQDGAFPTSLEDQDARAQGSQSVDALARIIHTSRGPYLVLVADHDVGTRQHRLDCLPIGVRGCPERWTVVEVEDRRVAVLFQRGRMRDAAVLARQPRTGHEQDGRIGDGLQVEVARFQLPIGTGRRSIEEQREAIGRPDLTEDDRRVERVVDTEPVHIDALGRQEIADEFTVSVVADLTHDRGGYLKPRQAGADIAGEAADVAGKAALVA